MTPAHASLAGRTAAVTGAGAGIARGIALAFAWHALLRGNLDTVLHGTQLAARRMVAAGVAGSIVNVTSIEGVRPASLYAAYAAATAGVIAVTRTTAVELAPAASA